MSKGVNAGFPGAEGKAVGGEYTGVDPSLGSESPVSESQTHV